MIIPDLAYYITLCVHNRKCLFGEIEDGDMYLNEYGEINYVIYHVIMWIC